MDELLLIGIGTGNPDHLTFQAAQAIRAADLILIPRKGADKADLADLRRQIIDRVTPGPSSGPGSESGPAIVEFDLPKRRAGGAYLDAVNDWHDAIAAAWTRAIATRPGARKVALLIWGDPSLYDSSLRIAARLHPGPRIEVVPGLTSLQVLTAAHGIALNDIGAPVLVTTGRRLRDQGWPAGVDTVAVMLDGQCSFTTLAAEGIDIWWGAFLGMKEQILMAGPLRDTGPAIIKARAAARARHGWIMDIYLLRRTRRG